MELSACSPRSLKQWLVNVALSAWIAGEAARILVLAGPVHGSAADVGIVVMLATTAVLVLARPPPYGQDLSIAAVIVSFASVLYPVLYLLLPPDLPQTASVGIIIQTAAVVTMLASTLMLGRNFSVVPQYRWLVARG